MQRVLLAGRTGQVGFELQSALAPLGTVIPLDRNQMDLCSADSIRKAIREAKPEIIVNAAGYTTVDKAESEPDLAMKVNGVASGIIAEEAKRIGALLVHYSTDYVFDGEQNRPYMEEDATRPVNVYGESKLAGERAIVAVGGAYVILRASWVYSARGTNFVLTILRLAREKPELSVVIDQMGSPTWARSLAAATAELLGKPNLRDAPGVYHLSATGFTSRFGFTEKIVALVREISSQKTGWAALRPITTAEYPLPAARPLHCITSTDKIKRVFGIEMPHWEDRLRAFLVGLSGPVSRGGDLKLLKNQDNQPQMDAD